MHRTTFPRLLAAALAVIAPISARADTSATLATAINIPKGPASIEGFGRAYEVSPASGLPSLSYPLEVPPGRAGHAPQLGLHYHAGGGASVLGLTGLLLLIGLCAAVYFGALLAMGFRLRDFKRTAR